MPRFAAAQDRVNRACIRHLADASGTLGGSPVEILFARDYVDSLGMSSSMPAATLPSASVPGNVIGMALQINGGNGVGNWRVVESRPDGAGMTVLMLESA